MRSNRVDPDGLFPGADHPALVAARVFIMNLATQGSLRLLRD